MQAIGRLSAAADLSAWVLTVYGLQTIGLPSSKTVGQSAVISGVAAALLLNIAIDVSKMAWGNRIKLKHNRFSSSILAFWYGAVPFYITNMSADQKQKTANLFKEHFSKWDTWHCFRCGPQSPGDRVYIDLLDQQHVLGISTGFVIANVIYQQVKKILIGY